MAGLGVFRVCYLLFCLVCYFELSSGLYEEHDIPEYWIDPTDMVNFDYGTKSNKKPSDTTGRPTLSETQAAPPPEDRPSATENENEIMYPSETHSSLTEEKNNELIKGAGGKDERSCASPFMRRFVSVLHKKMKHVGNPPFVQDFEIKIHLKENQWQMLKAFGEECGSNIQEVTNILETMIEDVHLPIEIPPPSLLKKFEDIFHMPFADALKCGVMVLLAVAVLTLGVVSRVSWTVQIRRLLVLAFFISIPLTYVHELRLAEAEYKAKAVDIPKECLGKQEDKSTLERWMSVGRSWFSVEEDPCTKYHSNFLITPHIKVTPTKVLAVTLTRFAVEPLEHVGTAFSKAFKNIFAGLPVTLWIPAFLFVILVILGFLLIVAVCFGYNFSFNLPFWAGLQMGPQQAVQQNPYMEQALADNRQHIEQLQTTIRELKERPMQQALPAPPAASPSRARAILGYFGIGGSPRDGAAVAPPPAPPYPGQQAPEADLPYPDFGPPPREYDRSRRPRSESHGSFSPTSDSFPDPHARAGLRRRHTDADVTRRYDAGDADNLPYPDPSQRNRATERRRDHIGFEHLVEQEEGTSGDTRYQSSRAKISTQTQHDPSVARQETAVKRVEEIDVTAVAMADGDHAKVTEVKPAASPKKHQPPKYTDIAKGHETVTFAKDYASTHESSTVAEESAPVSRDGTLLSGLPGSSTTSTATNDSVMIETIGDREPASSLHAEASTTLMTNGATGDTASPTAMDDWEQLSMELNSSHGAKCCGGCEKLSPQELMEVFQNEAEEGISFSSHNT